ncbi:serine hydrolase domain-containing protein [Sphingomonas qomolangmaensis]|uniref:Beta-lactamase family protein n=1 Tax=Sphingomonas qomolangmaensis TaxID=2918765 RepID=A0ABY5L6A2_9SPHN|nr:serine hydrolase domain-containing protein [Sphingomonas qomolangmaensis]UUL81593.1 beta-lactamase family protein [Sphingomonas qomolangmaensis]
MTALAALAAMLALAAPAQTPPPDEPAIAAALKAGGFSGFAMVATKDRILWQTPRAKCAPAAGTAITLCHPRATDQQRWPWASVSKQVLAILTMQQVDAGRVALDATVDAYLPALKGGGIAPTIRELLQHRSGLRNPDDSPIDAAGDPGFYSTGPTGLDWCLADRKAPGGDWAYNNCDSIVLAAALERVSGKTLAALFDEGLAKPLALAGTRYVDAGADGLPDFARPLPPGYAVSFERYGAAGGLAGTGADLLAIDRALAAGTLMSPAARQAMWAGDPALGYMALAQWVFDAPLKGCSKPVRIVERRGGIGRYQVRNIILPDVDRIVILFTDDEKLEFGEIWQGKGLSHDLLAATACR